MTIPIIVENIVVKETSLIMGVGSYILNGPVAGYFAFGDVFDSGNDIVYRATDGTNIEIANGTFDGSSISRGEIIASSNDDNPVNWTGQTRQIIYSVSIIT